MYTRTQQEIENQINANTTALEQEVLDNIIDTDFPADETGGPTWAFCATETGPTRLRGALASLIKKGYVGYQKETEADGADASLVWIVGYENRRFAYALPKGGA